ncbi:hypothetical protein [Parabacteroides timonensis]|uniref:hypothetical protein n=1 Tax=Parabacteroides timonensis TaxID=1871013 RepID=UPI00094E1FE8|nr:hypothetical protein [Parabacteroides timonensis]
MKRLWILILLVIVLPECLLAQQRTEYNRKGDEAMKRQDYSDARMWYEEGISNCDSYSINQLTAIWKTNKKMRASMRSLMTKCLNCLTVKATDNDSTAVAQLIVYYNEGIGTPISEELASYWSDRLEELRKPVEPITYVPVQERKPREPMKFFAGYAFSIEAPYGLTVGGVGERFGWYARFRTNMSFDDYTGECRGDNELLPLPENEAYQFSNRKKSNNMAALAGVVIKCTPWLYTSVGLGYGKRELLYEYTTTDRSDSNNKNTIWAKNTDYSYEGIAADLDFMVKFGSVFVSAGCNTLNFKYIDLNAGIGVFF